MRAEGKSRRDVLRTLKDFLSEDQDYSQGRILNALCTTPHPIAKAAHKLFLNSNLGGPALFPGSRKMEQQVIQNLSSLLHSETSVGFVVSGGTEANMLALLAARNKASIEAPEVIVPESAHFSFRKICSLLKLKLVTAPVDASYRADTHAIEEQLSKNTVAIVGTAGTPELGVVDPVKELSELASSKDVYLHVDAAFGGLILPFMKELGYSFEPFDFQLESVKSITVDPHKMGMSTIPSGGILFRDESYLRYVETETPYLTERVQYTFVGTRTASSVAAAWAVFEHLGANGMKKIIGRCIKLARYLASELESHGFTLVCPPTLNVVAFRSKNTELLAQQLRRYGWFVSYLQRLNCIRVIIMPHIKRSHVDAFLNMLQRNT